MSFSGLACHVPTGPCLQAVREAQAKQNAMARKKTPTPLKIKGSPAAVARIALISQIRRVTRWSGIARDATASRNGAPKMQMNPGVLMRESLLSRTMARISDRHSPMMAAIAT